MKKIWALLLVLSMGFSSTLMADKSFIEGKAMASGNEVLPPKVTFEVVLEDVSRADAASILIAKQTFEPIGQFPISFKLAYDDDKIQLGQRYAVRAKITQGKKLLYITDTYNPAFVGNDMKHLTLMLKKVAKDPESRVMEGMYKYMADAALFKDCMTGKYYPVAFKGDNAALEKAYLNEVNGSNYYVKVEVKGKVIKSPKMEGEGEEATLLVEEFLRITGLKDCTVQQANVPMTNNYWKLTQLYNQKMIKLGCKQKEAHILLREGLNGAGELKVVTGCHTLKGNYKIDENTVQFHFDMPKEDGEDCVYEDLEKTFMSVLKNTLYWRIEGETLKLYDELDNHLASFEAVYF